MPLNVDSCSFYCLQAPNVAPLTEFVDLLDGFGHTSNTGSSSNSNRFPGLVGITLAHVALALETSPVPRLVAVGAAASVTFVRSARSQHATCLGRRRRPFPAMAARPRAARRSASA